MEMKELIFECMCGEVVPEQVPVELKGLITDAFAPGSRLEELGEEVYRLKNEISQRLGCEEDAQLTELVSVMEEMNRLLCYQMYEYGIKKSQ